MYSLISKYHILKENELIIEHHSGNLDIGSFINFKTTLSTDPSFSPNFNFIMDLRDVTFETSESDLKKYADFLTNSKKYKGKRKIAVITNTPNQVVSSVLFKQMYSNPSHIIEIFSTVNSALKWLQIEDLSVLKIKNAIESLKNTV
ncbi:MAG: hypothetical protein COB01_10290 [Lutibacter sp.]|nr:MAG: hypothetical protein COB01_10290 [Lutibacter sp.]